MRTAMLVLLAAALARCQERPSPGDCFEGSLTVEKGRDLRELRGYTCITGDLLVVGTRLDALEGLEALTSVGGDLVIESNEDLVNLDGLGALASVGGDLEIRSDPALVSLDGLGALASVGGSLDISHDRELGAWKRSTASTRWAAA
jgi:hypothetical protein